MPLSTVMPCYIQVIIDCDVTMDFPGNVVTHCATMGHL